MEPRGRGGGGEGGRVAVAAIEGGSRPAVDNNDEDDADDADGFYFLQLAVEAEVRVTYFPLPKVAHDSGGGASKLWGGGESE